MGANCVSTTSILLHWINGRQRFVASMVLPITKLDCIHTSCQDSSVLTPSASHPTSVSDAVCTLDCTCSMMVKLSRWLLYTMSQQISHIFTDMMESFKMVLEVSRRLGVLGCHALYGVDNVLSGPQCTWT